MKKGEFMAFIKICKIAYDLLKEDDLVGIYLIKDIGDSFVFYGGNPKQAYYGLRTVSVNKKTGDAKWCNSNLDYELLEKGIEIGIPSEYMYKAS